VLCLKNPSTCTTVQAVSLATIVRGAATRATAGSQKTALQRAQRGVLRHLTHSGACSHVTCCATRPAGLGRACLPPNAMMKAATSWATGTVNEIRAMNVRQLLLQAVNLGESASTTAYIAAPPTLAPCLTAGYAAGLIITSALIIWKSLILWTGSDSPVRAFSRWSRS